MMRTAARCWSAAREVVEEGDRARAKDLEVAATDLEFSKGRYRVKGTDISVASRSSRRNIPAPSTRAATLPTARSLSERGHVARNRDRSRDGRWSGSCATRPSTIAGVVINHVLLDGQLQGGIARASDR